MGCKWLQNSLVAAAALASCAATLQAVHLKTVSARQCTAEAAKAPSGPAQSSRLRTRCDGCPFSHSQSGLFQTQALPKYLPLAGRLRSSLGPPRWHYRRLPSLFVSLRRHLRTDISQVPKHRKAEIRRFFEDYKKNENKEVQARRVLSCCTWRCPGSCKAHVTIFVSCADHTQLETVSVALSS